MRHFASEHFTAAVSRPIELAVVVPTLNERANIEATLANLAVALDGIEWEILFVDDGSGDGTPDLITGLAARDRRIRLLRRFGRRGLASAVVEGIFASTAPVVAVMDADLQHDEAILPRLYEAVARDGCDLAIGTRYGEGGSIDAWSKERAWISRLATRLAAPLVKAPVSDPMSGFFAVRRETMLAAVPRISAIGYKILLDILASAPKPLRVREVPYAFRARIAGESKLDGGVVLDYLELLCDKAVGRVIPAKLILFGAVGSLGLIIHLAILAQALNAGQGFERAQAIAVLGAMTFNFALNNRLTYRDRRLAGWPWLKGLVSFYAVCSLGALTSIGVGSAVHQADQTWWVAGIAGAVIGAVWNYAATAWLTWSRR